jgi:hypothetical protein
LWEAPTVRTLWKLAALAALGVCVTAAGTLAEESPAIYRGWLRFHEDSRLDGWGPYSRNGTVRRELLLADLTLYRFPSGVYALGRKPARWAGFERWEGLSGDETDTSGLGRLRVSRGAYVELKLSEDRDRFRLLIRATPARAVQRTVDRDGRRRVKRLKRAEILAYYSGLSGAFRDQAIEAQEIGRIVRLTGKETRTLSDAGRFHYSIEGFFVGSDE